MAKNRKESNLKPRIEKYSPEEVAEETLRSEILAGEWQEGAPLREIALSERFAVGRSVIREILRDLSRDGLAEMRPNCGVRVAVSPPDVLEPLLRSLRQQIEVFALETAFDTLDEAAFARFDEVLERMKAACEDGDHLRVAEADISFHRLIVESADLPDLVALWKPMLSRLRKTFLALQVYRSDNLMAVYHEHAAILSIIRAGDPKPAIQLLNASVE